MFKILERYIAKMITAATGLAILIVVGVLTLILLLGQLKNLGEGDYGLLSVILYVLLRLPSELYQFSPLLVLLGSIVGLSVLSSHRELAVMRTAGFSIKQIIKSVLFVAFLIIITISLIGESIGPSLSYRAEVAKENARNAGQAVVTAAGLWFHIDNNFIHVEHVVSRQLLEGVTRYQFDDKRRLTAAYYANSMVYQDRQWQMFDVVKTTFYDERTKSIALKNIEWDLPFNSNLLSMGLVEPSEMSLPKLVKLTRYLEQNGQQAREYKFNFWKRVFQPLASLVMVFLAIPFVLGALSTATMGWRILAGILVGFTFFILNAMLGEISVVFQLSPMLAALLPPLIFVIIGIILAKRMITR